MASTVFEGDLRHETARFGIVVSRWNDLVTRRLLDGALGALARYDVGDDRVEVVWVPGCWETPLAADALLRTGRVQAVICVGAILRGETPHAEYLASTVSHSLNRLAAERGMPVSWGVLTCDTLDQALERAGSKMGNKGAEAALAALEMVSLLDKVKQGG
ncbi:MAG: 6,7-dimethyl-8-ribityllumazine synthase [Fimbriimonadia bacterium]|jgi:6,7-dimethyl-8-ribityllumazine synthase